MKYTVHWKPSLKQRLAEIWLNAPNRRAVAEAANHIDRVLRLDPLRQGESRQGERTRLWVIPPLAVVFEVHPSDLTVDVLSVRHVPRRSPGG